MDLNLGCLIEYIALSFVFLFPASFVFILLFLYQALRYHSLIQKIKNLPTSKIRSVAYGLAEFYGKVRPIKRVISPISKKNCACYELIVFHYSRRGRKRGWFEIYHDKSFNSFYLEDETGTLLIDLNKISHPFSPSFKEEDTFDIDQVFFSEGHLTPSGFAGLPRQKLDDRAIQFLNSIFEREPHLKKFSDDKFKVEEYILEENQNIYVIGSVEKNFEAGASSPLYVTKGKDGIFYIGNREEKKIIENLNKKFLSVIAWALLFIIVPVIIILIFFVVVNIF
ncbi:MAG: hypothetical protein QXF35_01360 [Candidatus Bilamarchaeaceae archaeon]